MRRYLVRTQKRCGFGIFPRSRFIALLASHLPIILIGMTRKQTKIVGLMNADAFMREVRDRARFSHAVLITDHVLLDRADRNITRMMIIRALRKGTLRKPPAWSAAHGNWTGSVQYIGTGIDLTVVCALKEGVLTVTVVTAYGTPR
jgi:hypothetical protein